MNSYDYFDDYDLTDDERRELEYKLSDAEQFIDDEEDQIVEESNLQDILEAEYKNRILYYFNSESHWIGWLKVNGIIW